ncbi:hypothetical protein D3A95_13335 [Thermosynechococcus sichuanensis E542]|uniref:Uncharacterized protein n=1 Tax=Thermosynechococcus sichuanensis E542 TaxID=2016101 RepID=A0A7D6ERX1_9CYAN|nr:hypothetical protein [Thermosynechococcus vestitus]QLL29467.1 hypothetical protein D3A95_13335 [Thermosynechococcus vestitus E542]
MASRGYLSPSPITTLPETEMPTAARMLAERTRTKEEVSAWLDRST